MEIDVPQSQNQPLETEMGTLQRLLHLLNAQHEHGGAHGHDDGDGECRRKAPVAVFTVEVMVGPTAWPSVVVRLRMPRSLPASSLFGSTSTLSAWSMAEYTP